MALILLVTCFSNVTGQTSSDDAGRESNLLSGHRDLHVFAPGVGRARGERLPATVADVAEALVSTRIQLTRRVFHGPDHVLGMAVFASRRRWRWRAN